MRDAARTGTPAFLRLTVCGVGMAHAHDDTGLGHLSDECRGASQFRCDRDHLNDVIEAFHKFMEGLPSRFDERCRIKGAASRRIEERTFEMNTQDTGNVYHRDA